jgi:hypothetical protein
LNIFLHQAKPDVSVKFLTPLVQHKARTAFYAHFFSSLIVRSQTGECSTIVNVSLYSDDINADLFSYLTLNIPARNVLTIAKKPTTKFLDRLIKNAV